LRKTKRKREKRKLQTGEDRDGRVGLSGGGSLRAGLRHTKLWGGQRGRTLLFQGLVKCWYLKTVCPRRGVVKASEVVSESKRSVLVSFSVKTETSKGGEGDTSSVGDQFNTG